MNLNALLCSSPSQSDGQNLRTRKKELQTSRSESNLFKIELMSCQECSPICAGKTSWNILSNISSTSSLSRVLLRNWFHQQFGPGLNLQTDSALLNLNQCRSQTNLENDFYPLDDLYFVAQNSMSSACSDCSWCCPCFSVWCPQKRYFIHIFKGSFNG